MPKVLIHSNPMLSEAGEHVLFVSECHEHKSFFCLFAIFSCKFRVTHGSAQLLDKVVWERGNSLKALHLAKYNGNNAFHFIF